MSRRKKKVAIKFLSAGVAVDQYGNKNADSFAMVPESFMLSLACHKLKFRQRYLVICCLSKEYGHIKPCDDKNHPAHEQFKDNPNAFYLSFSDVTDKYGIYGKKDYSGFYNDIKVLEEHGIIKKLWSGRGHKAKSIYCFSNDWISWKPI